MRPQAPGHTDIVLIGGGHAHVHVLRSFGMRPEPGVRVTLITRDLQTPYSGMLPGVVAGLYSVEQAHIDLVRLAAATGTRLIHAEAVGLDRNAKRILLAGQAPVGYDLTSIDVGITPALDSIRGAATHAIAVKPIGSFLDKFNRLLVDCRHPSGPRRIAVIGGGAGGVELILSLCTRIRQEAGKAKQNPGDFSFLLVTDGEILRTHNACVRRTFRRVFESRGVALHENRPAVAVHEGAIELADGTSLDADLILVTTSAAPPAWFAQTGLALDAGGFLAVRATLQSENDADVFAAGDCAAITGNPREKAGVFAVRAGPPLSDNLRRRAAGRSLKDWRPQRRHLALISTGERYAIASRGWFKAEGRWVWILKDWIDRRWMRMYQEPERMSGAADDGGGRH